MYLFLLVKFAKIQRMIITKYIQLVFVAVLFFNLNSQAQKQTIVTARAYVTLFPAGDFIAQFTGKGFATLTKDGLTAENIEIQVDSFNSGISLRDSHAKNKYLNMKEFPVIKLIKAKGAKGIGEAEIKIKEKVNKVSGTYSIVDKKSVLVKFKIKLSDFEIAKINFKGVGVEDDVAIEVNVPLTIQSQQLGK